MHSPNFYLQQALELAKSRRGFCAPNPAVGAVIVKEGQIIAQGVHVRAGCAHAEVDALNQLGGRADGASLFVTLEPCCHFGKTPPCTQQIIHAGIKEVFFGFSDPHEHVAGSGQRELEAAGVACHLIEIPEITKFYESYSHWIRTKLPFVTAKIAISFDGKIAAKDGLPISITGTELQQFTHRCRKESDAILTTVKTVINDDPSLNAREEDQITAKPLYVVDRQLRLPQDANIFRTSHSITLFYAEKSDSQKVYQLQQRGIRCVPIPERENKLILTEILKIIGEDGIHDLWIEAGGEFFSHLLVNGVMQRSLIYIAPKILGSDALSAFGVDSFNCAHAAKNIQWVNVGNDVVCEIIWSTGGADHV